MSASCQRYINEPGKYTLVFDTYTGKWGSIIEWNLSTNAVPPLAPLYTGPYMVILYKDEYGVDTTDKQVFTSEGKRVDHTTGTTTDGIVLLNRKETEAIMTVGYIALPVPDDTPADTIP